MKKKFIIILFITSFLFVSCVVPNRDTTPDETVSPVNLYDPTHIILPEGQQVLVKDNNNIVTFIPTEDLSYVMESKYQKLESKYLQLLETLELSD